MLAPEVGQVEDRQPESPESGTQDDWNWTVALGQLELGSRPADCPGSFGQLVISNS